MLSFDHVRVRRKGNELVLEPLGKLRGRALELGEVLVALARSHVGAPREELERAFESIEVAPRERRLYLGLCKLVEDACEFEASAPLDPVELRSELFLRSAELRREGRFDRGALLAAQAARLGTSAQVVEQALYADLRAAHRLVSCSVPDPEPLVAAYERAQIQALLLRATKVTAVVRCRSADGYRDLFRKLKFRRLLHQVTALEQGYRLEIDGPYSLFDSVAKYGLELALVLPALEACDELELSAEIKAREGGPPLLFRYTGGGARGPRGADQAAPLRDEVAELLRDLTALRDAGEKIDVRLGERILELPGLGLCVPDLAVEVEGASEPVYVEVLGFWSRESVWKRVELVERGLSARIVFAVSSRLRVSEEVLEESPSASLYVYRGRINPRALLRAVLGVAGVTR